MEQAIRKSIEGGYIIPTRVVSSNEILMSIGAEKPKNYTVLWGADIALDPLFWQSLIKGLGWTLDHETYGWIATWHQFIDHLIHGNSAEDFFNKLFK